MYARVLLVSDSTREGLVALHEGALVARSAGAEVFLLIVEREHPALTIADAIHPLPVRGGEPLLETGLVRLRGLGLKAQGATAQGEPARVIADYARAFPPTSSWWAAAGRAALTAGGGATAAPI